MAKGPSAQWDAVGWRVRHSEAETLHSMWRDVRRAQPHQGHEKGDACRLCEDQIDCGLFQEHRAREESP